MRIEIDCTVEGIVYKNPDNGYVICEVQSPAEGAFYAVGYMPTVLEGEAVRLTGNWVTHPEYGEQFKVELYESVMPTEGTAIIKYLSSGIVKGVREATAKKLYETFGDEVFNVLATDPEEIATVKGIGIDRAKMMCHSFNEQRSVQNIVMFLQQYNITANTAIKIHKQFGNDSVNIIKENPYMLASNVDGVSFKTADMIAYNLGLPKNSHERICCAVTYVLRDAAYTNGHTYMPKSLFMEHIVYMLDITEIEAENAIAELVANREIFIDRIEGEESIYLSGFYHDEKYIASRIRSMMESESEYAVSYSLAEEETSEFEDRNHITLAKNQREAVITALTGNCMILTGGPGTGKTTTLNAIISILKGLNLKVALAAPTGRAAKRMAQLTGHEAKTLHRLLGAQVMGNSHIFSHDEENVLTYDIIILDEVSMVDTALMASFLRAVKPGGRVILSGDSDQLPSVGAGNVLHDLIESGVMPVVKLTDIFRQSEESLIIVNAHKINNGEIPELKERTRDFFFMRRNTPQEVAQTITDLYRNRLPKSYGVNALTDIQVLTPTKKGITGTVELNKILQRSVNPSSPEKLEHKYGDTVFREGDKIMQTKNNYDMEYYTQSGERGVGIYNGDMGIIDSIHTEEKYMIISFDDGKIVEYPFTDLDEVELSYAITVHKSQGSEFPYVLIPVAMYMPMLMTRNLFYTAITRAKTMVILVGSEKIIENMTHNKSYTKRFTGLRERLLRNTGQREMENEA